MAESLAFLLRGRGRRVGKRPLGEGLSRARLTTFSPSLESQGCAVGLRPCLSCLCGAQLGSLFPCLSEAGNCGSNQVWTLVWGSFKSLNPQEGFTKGQKRHTSNSDTCLSSHPWAPAWLAVRGAPSTPPPFTRAPTSPVVSVACRQLKHGSHFFGK